jgi:hypothetical protein
MDTDMGERQSDGSAHGRRRVHPAGAVSHRDGTSDSTALEALLAATMREATIDAEAEQRAVAAFRAARDAGVHRARTRRRDDWRPREHRHTRRSVKATVAVFLASLTLGGVAFAAIGSAGSSDDGHGRPQPHPSAGTGGASRNASGKPGSATPDRPATAKDTEAHCRAWEQVKDRGQAIGSTAWQRLVAEAGGKDKVAAYCARQLAQASPGSKSNKADKTPGSTAETPGSTADNGNANGGGTGNDQGKADNSKGKQK